jgi:hypothetical protein
MSDYQHQDDHSFVIVLLIVVVLSVCYITCAKSQAIRDGSYYDPVDPAQADDRPYYR